MMRKSLILLVPVALAACEAPRPLQPVTDVRVASATEVVGCTPVRVITTTPGVSGSMVGPRTMELARNETLATARSAGANTFVFDEGAQEFLISGTAYNC